jgi:hypothetical protein
MHIDYNKLDKKDKTTFAMWRNGIIAVYAVVIIILVVTAVDMGRKQHAVNDGFRLAQISASASK